MPFDVIGFCEASPGTGTVNLARAAGDTLYTGGAGDNITLRKINGKQPVILGVHYAAESTPGYCRVRQASLDWYHEFIKACDLNGVPTINGLTNLGFGRDRVLPLVADEDCQVFSNNVTDEDTIITLYLGDGFLGLGARPDFFIRGTIDQTLTVNTWTLGTVTWSQTLKGGADAEYAIVGLKVGAYLATPGCGAARLVGLQGNNRPGVPLEIAGGDKTVVSGAYYNPYAEWPIMQGISFHPNAMPNLELLSPIADTDFAVEMAVKRIK